MATPVSWIPDFLYGTAWKEERTPALVELALRMGFRGIDTANQRQHYFEAGVGQGLAAAYREGVVTRADVFLQTKFTNQRGHDHRLPYDPEARLSVQVAQSMAGSLEQPVYMQRGRKRLAGDHHGTGSSLCAAIFSRWPPLALHHSGHQSSHFFVVGGLSRRDGSAPSLARLEQARARV
jgi:hypothetical protein